MIPSVSPTIQTPGSATREMWHPPGGILVWMLSFLELITFGAGLAVFLHLKASDPASFRTARGDGHVGLAFINTLLLLTGGWAMAHAVVRLREGRHRAARPGILLAGSSGVAFLGLKGWEYFLKLDRGLGLNHDTFHTLYWLLTGFHFLHVLVAVILLAAMSRTLRAATLAPEQAENVEASGVFWHLCDLVWLLLVPVIYLLP